MKAKDRIPTGYKLEHEIEKNKEKIKKLLGATEADWTTWQWQIGHQINHLEIVEQIIELTEDEKEVIRHVGTIYRWAVSPYFASLMSPDDRACPIRLQAVPSIKEIEGTGVPDFTGEEHSSPAPAVVRWYPDRVIIYTSNRCGSFCRHCLRRRLIAEIDKKTPQRDLDKALEYVRENREIRDVLLTGGDPLTLSDDEVDWLLSELDDIKHVEIKRIGSRTPCTLPQRITDHLCSMLQRHHPLYVNVQFNHPKEITKTSAKACDMLSRAGIPLGNQTVLLKGVNDDPNVMKLLCQELLRIRVRPYYIYHCEGTVGISHFRTPVEKGIEIMENLRGYTSGLAVPQYIVSAPGSLGKTPLGPQYLISSGEGYVLLRNWEGKAFRYVNPCAAQSLH